MSPARISLVVPCHDGGLYLADAFASVRGQSRMVDEIILIDDGSTDGSTAAAAAQDRSIIYHRQDQAGASAARNQGVALATGDILAFLDADDLWTPDSIEIRLALLRANPDADYVFGAVEQFFSPDLPETAPASLSAVSQIGRLAGSMLIRRATWERVGPLDPSLKAGEMFDWVARANAHGASFASTDAVVLRRRIHETNSVHRHDVYRADSLRALRKAVQLKKAGGC